MREILFRGKRTDTGEWVVSDCLYQCSGTVKLWDEPNKDGWVEVIPETVGQFTGLYDKNGKRIFEGDIVTGLFLHGLSVNAVVTFKDGAFGLEWHRGNIKTFDAFTSICNVKYEVIGNIHDNPDLMKGERNER